MRVIFMDIYEDYDRKLKRLENMQVVNMLERMKI
jgi:hypothetical protein